MHCEILRGENRRTMEDYMSGKIMIPWGAQCKLKPGIHNEYGALLGDNVKINQGCILIQEPGG